MTTTGTHHFRSMDDAVRYYATYGDDLAEVQRKLDTGEIAIGKPRVWNGRLISEWIVDEDGRYRVRF